MWQGDPTVKFQKLSTEFPTRVRWRVGLLLAASALAAHFQRVSISVSGDSIMQEFEFSQTKMGTVFSAFVLGYTLFQVPGGMLADRWGTKKVLGWAMVSWSLFTFLTGLIGQISVLTGLGVFNALITLRFVFGIFQAPLFPASTRLVANWFPTRERGSGNALALTGISVGSLLMPPIVSWIVLSWSWQGSFYLAASLSLLVAAVWTHYVRDYPSHHYAVNPAERNLIEEARHPTRILMSIHRRFGPSCAAAICGDWSSAILFRGTSGMFSSFGFIFI